MENEEKIRTFEKELNYIYNPNIKKFAEEAIKILPNYFFKAPASSTSRHHPKFAQGESGLLRHTIAAIKIAVELFRTDLWELTSDKKDLILASLILHDGFKLGINEEKYTRFDHPLIVCEELSKNKCLKDLLPEEQFEFIIENIKSHMGKWRFSKDNKEIMPVPKTVSQKLTHLADYLSSRKIIEINFNEEISR